MHDTVLVRCLQRLGDLPRNVQCLFQRERTFRDAFRQG